jgi:CMP-N,N'-diacetyllegionaminic acid synthase
MNNILWLISARSGSKSIVHKNIKNLNGYPLLAYRIKSAMAISKPEDVWVSTDSKEYADIAMSHGAFIPFLRPDILSTDTASSVDVVLHAMFHANKIEKKYDAIGLLEPTSPFITSKQLFDSVNQLFGEDDSENIVAVRNVRPHTYFVQEKSKYLNILAQKLSTSNKLRRQDRNDEVTPSGGFYISKWNSFLKNKTFYTEKTLQFQVPELNGIEIDEPIDWLWAEFLLEKGIITHNELFNENF